jgi:hypothetical protein
MPLLTEYNAKHRIVRIEERLSQDAPLEMVWEDEEYCFTFKKRFSELSSEEFDALLAEDFKSQTMAA